MGRRHVYGAVGAALSLGAPLGLCLVRSFQARAFSLAALRGDIAGDVVTYLYVSLSTLVAFALFGFVLGGQADRLFLLSMTDALTGLRNQRALYERIEEELARAARHGTALSLLLIDVDHLKMVNDEKGHRAGDAALRHVAAAVNGGSRATDVGARWGGDEFAILAPNTDAEAALHLAERVRALAADESNGLFPLTVSIGVATAGSSPATPESLLRAADVALYRAKAAGRNRVAVA